MLHVLFATVLSVSTAFSADSVRPAAKPGPVRPDSTVLTLPAPSIKAPDSPAPTIAALVALAWPAKRPADTTHHSPAVERRTDAGDVAQPLSSSSSTPLSVQAQAVPPRSPVVIVAAANAVLANVVSPNVVSPSVASATPADDAQRVADATQRPLQVVQHAATLKTASLGVAMAPADASAVARSVGPQPSAPAMTSDGRMVMGTRSTVTIEPLHAVPLPAAGLRLGPPSAADSIVVYKRERTLTLFYRGVPLRSYFVALGGSPVGDKLRAGDQRTPEGVFYINAHNPASKYHLALRISYPDAAHRARSDSLGVNPGGDIMIHGLPAEFSDAGKDHRVIDWTNGCVALSNPEIEEIWRAVPDGTPVQIKP